jgi:hypothetical protein
MGAKPVKVSGHVAVIAKQSNGFRPASELEVFPSLEACTPNRFSMEGTGVIYMVWAEKLRLGDFTSARTLALTAISPYHL